MIAWVKPDGEAEVRAAFAHARAVRKLGGEARTLADRFFFETLVRVHRAGEGAPFTGLKPAGQDLGPAVAAADRAVATGSAQKLEELLVEEVRHGLRARFAALRRASRPATTSPRGARGWTRTCRTCTGSRRSTARRPPAAGTSTRRAPSNPPRPERTRHHHLLQVSVPDEVATRNGRRELDRSRIGTRPHPRPDLPRSDHLPDEGRDRP